MVVRGRVGATVTEVVVALVLGLLLAGITGRALRTVQETTRTLAGRSDRLATVRLVRSVVAADLADSHGAPPLLEWSDSLPLRVFRGVGYPCGTSAGPLVVELTGLRLPDPDKDSVLVLTADGQWRAHDLTDARGTDDACRRRLPASDGVQRWTLSPAPVTRPVLLRVFERGSYHLVDGALRYRRGFGGRQPLSAEHLDRASGFRGGSGAASAILTFDEDVAWVVSLPAAGPIP